jgi:hypothetical protein
MSQALIDELSKAEYASLSDQAAADAINAKTVTVRVLVPTANVVAHATMNGYRHKITIAAANASHPCQGLAIDIAAYIDSMKIQNVDMDLPETQAMLIAMVQCGFATPEQVASLDALANRTLRWVDYVSAGTQSAHSVRVVRDLINGATAKRAEWTQQNVDRYNVFQAAIDAWNHGDPDLVINGN